MAYQNCGKQYQAGGSSYNKNGDANSCGDQLCVNIVSEQGQSPLIVNAVAAINLSAIVDNGSSPYTYEWKNCSQDENDPSKCLKLQTGNSGDQDFVTVVVTDSQGRKVAGDFSTYVADATSINAPGYAPDGIAALIIDGSANSCVRFQDGSYKCWGPNSFGELGDGTTEHKNSPTYIPLLAGVKEISYGIGSACALYANKTVSCWGRNSYGQLGDGTTTSRLTPVAVQGLSNVESISLSYNHACAKLSNKTVKCWGLNSNGQLGDGTTTNRSTPVSVQGLSNVESIRAGGLSNTCAILTDKTVKCWGNNYYGQLGDGTTTNRSIPVSVQGLTNTQSIHIGGFHACALLADATVKCWGQNTAGQLGDGTYVNKNIPISVLGLSGVEQVGVGYSFSCVHLNDGRVMCWGANSFSSYGSGLLGDGTNINKNIPVSVLGQNNAVQIGVGTLHACALLDDGHTKCWGINVSGELGIGTARNIIDPVFMPNLEGAQQIVIGSSDSKNGCGLFNGIAKCWGSNSYGQLGDGTTTNRSTPVTVQGLSNIQSLSMSGYHTCALLADKTAKCWGLNSSGQLGDGTTANRSTPVTVQGLSNIQSMSTSGYNTCALLADKTVKCWGINSYGQLGDGTTTSRSTPVSVQGLSNVQNVSAGAGYTCALLVDKTVKCLGYNYYGQLGDGTTTNRSIPVRVQGLSNIQSISAGGAGHTCALLADKTVKCWGVNYYGQLGDGTTTNRSTPVTVQGLSNAQSIDVGYFSCSKLVDKSVQCWGNHKLIEPIYMDTGLKTLLPEEIGIQGATSVSVGAYGCSILENGKVKCWGNNSDLSLKKGPNTSVPITVVWP